MKGFRDRRQEKGQEQNHEEGLNHRGVGSNIEMLPCPEQGWGSKGWALGTHSRISWQLSLKSGNHPECDS